MAYVSNVQGSLVCVCFPPAVFINRRDPHLGRNKDIKVLEKEIIIGGSLKENTKFTGLKSKLLLWNI